MRAASFALASSRSASLVVRSGGREVAVARSRACFDFYSGFLPVCEVAGEGKNKREARKEAKTGRSAEKYFSCSLLCGSSLRPITWTFVVVLALHVSNAQTTTGETENNTSSDKTKILEPQNVFLSDLLYYKSDSAILLFFRTTTEPFNTGDALLYEVFFNVAASMPFFIVPGCPSLSSSVFSAQAIAT